MQRSYKCLTVCLLLLASPVFAVAEQTLEIGKGERLLVLAPHPDDESLSSAGLIQQVLQNGGSVRSTVVTSGDAYVGAVMLDSGKRNPSAADYLDFGEKRLEESRRAANILGQGFVHLDLLGFSDGSIYSALVSHWRHNNPMRSEYTGFDHVPYREAEDRGFAQDGQDLLNELVAILQDTKPTIIAFPDVMENDSDHAGLGMFTLLAVHNWLSQNPAHRPQPKLLAYLIHWQNGWPPGSNWGMAQDWSDQSLPLPADLPLRGHSRVCVALSPEQINLKRTALAEYKTQQRIMGDFLSAFVRRSECFTQLKPSDGNHIEQVLEHWRHVRKVFDNHPLSRRKILPAGS
ncbi:PIG-L deacetylase family protein [Methylomonas sp. 2BW1-5-20]|uniref:PIG-L deacetylase family protein n=1 Tax=Methylomonas sp. 2BW1-5-20 TaxID=3376686 RepID=UPI00404BA4C6